MLLVDHDEPEVFQGREDRGAWANGDGGVAGAQPPPRVVALAPVHLRVEDGNLVAEVRPEALDGLRREGDLGHEDDAGPPVLADGLEGPDVDLGLATARDAVEQKGAVAGRVDRIGHGVEGVLLGREQVVVRRRIRRGQVVEGRAHHLFLHQLHHALVHQAADGRVRRVGPLHHVDAAGLGGALGPEACEGPDHGLLLLPAELLDEVVRGLVVLKGGREAEVRFRLGPHLLVGEGRLHLEDPVGGHATDQRERHGGPQALANGREGRVSPLGQVVEDGRPHLVVGPRTRIGVAEREAVLRLDGSAGREHGFQGLAPVADVVVGDPLGEPQELVGAHRHVVEHVQDGLHLKVEGLGRRALLHHHAGQAPIAEGHEDPRPGLHRVREGVRHAIRVGLIEREGKDDVDGHRGGGAIVEHDTVPRTDRRHAGAGPRCLDPTATHPRQSAPSRPPPQS